MRVRRPPQEQLRAQPPVLNVDSFFCSLQRHGHGPEVISPIDVPLDLVSISCRSERLEPVKLCDMGPLTIGCLLVLFVVAMIGVDDVLELADLVLEVDGFDFGIVEMGI